MAKLPPSDSPVERVYCINCRHYSMYRFECNHPSNLIHLEAPWFPTTRARTPSFVLNTENRCQLYERKGVLHCSAAVLRRVGGAFLNLARGCPCGRPIFESWLISIGIITVVTVLALFFVATVALVWHALSAGV